MAADALDQQITNLLEKRGRFKLIFLFMICVSNLITGMNHNVTVFHTYMPKYHCKGQENKTCDCDDGYWFDRDDANSLTTEFELVCNKFWIGPTLNSCYYVGVTIGALFCSSLTDIFGRRTVILVCLYVQGLFQIAEYFSPNLATFIAFRSVQGIFVQGLQSSSYTMMMETSPSRLRTISSIYWENNWVFGLFFLSTASYFLRDWRELMLALIAPTAISLLYTWYFPESLPWLQSKGKRVRAVKTLCRIAKCDKRTEITDQCEALAKSAKQDEEQQAKDKAEGTEQEKVKLGVIFSNPTLRKHLLSLMTVWFGVSSSYYGILFYLPNLAGERHLNFAFGAVIESIGYTIAWPIFQNFGRIKSMCVLQYMNTFFIFLIAVLSAMPAEWNVKYVMIPITLIAKGLACTCFAGSFILGTELMPTVCRGMGFGFFGLAARVGSLLAPQIMSLTVIGPDFIPLAILFTFLGISGTIGLLLPETLNIVLPNTIAEAEAVWG